MTQLLPPKKEVALALLERSNVDVYLDPRAKGVVVPPQFRKEPRLILKIGLNMPVPIPDLRLDDESMSCTLSFNRSPFYCVVPWSSCFAMVGEDGRGMVWPDDVPQELAVKVVEPTSAGQGTSSKTPALSTATAPRSVPHTNGGAARGDQPRSGRGAGRSSKIASTTDEASASASERTKNGEAKKKRGKKKDEGRPVLVSVPSGPSSVPGSESDGIPQAAGSPASQRDGSQRDGVSAIPSSPASRRPGLGQGTRPSSQPSPSLRRPPPSDASRAREGQARPKRELPPYLRVVK